MFEQAADGEQRVVVGISDGLVAVLLEATGFRVARDRIHRLTALVDRNFVGAAFAANAMSQVRAVVRG